MNKFALLVAVVVGLLTSNVYAQNRARTQPAQQVPQVYNHVNGWGGGWHGYGYGNGWGYGGWGGGTAAGNYLNGLSHLYQGQGMFLQSYGKYLISREQARRLYVDNWKHSVRSKWEIQDENKARFRRDNPTFIKAEEHRLEMAARLHILKDDKEKAVKFGWIEEPQKPAFFYKGKKYDSYSDFKNSPEFSDLKAQARLNTMKYELEERANEQAANDALIFLSKWGKMSDWERKMYVTHRETDKIVDRWDGTSNYEVLKKKK